MSAEIHCTRCKEIKPREGFYSCMIRTESTGWCKECAKRAAGDYRSRNREWVAENERECRERRDRVPGYKAKRQAVQKRWFEANRDQINRRRRERYRQKHPQNQPPPSSVHPKRWPREKA